MHAIGIISIIFFLSELALSILKRSKKQNTKKQDDKGSLALFWVLIPVVLTTASLVRWYSPVGQLPWYPCFMIGLVLTIAGLLIRWIAIYQLGNLFTVDVSIASNHSLKTNGLYSVVRHPSYTGLLMVMVGIAFSMGNWISLIIVVIPFFLILRYRITVEENILKNAFGEDYFLYQQHTKKLIPGIY